MATVPSPKRSFARYPLWVLLTAPLAVGAFLALGKWLAACGETLDLAMPSPNAVPTEWARASEAVIVAAMIVGALRTGRVRSILLSRESPVWYGAVALFTAGFFRLAHGPWGTSLSLYGIVTSALTP